MKVIRAEHPVAIDVDETLVRDPRPGDLDVIDLNYYGVATKKVPIQRHIDLLKSYKSRGYFVEVWSANGFAWAEEVITKLKLDAYVDLIKTKPEKYVDDKLSDNWMQRVFIDE